MAITYKEWDKITFPIYLLPEGEIVSEDGLLFVDGLIYDDKNVKSPRLGVRRIGSPFKDQMQPIRRMIEDEIGLVKRPSKENYIDSEGRVFQYEKTIRTHLKYFFIREVELKDTYSILHIPGLAQAWRVPRPPPVGYPYVGILYYKEFPWKLYEYCKYKKKDTWRMI